MVFPVVGGTQDTAAYEISNSLRFNDDDNPSLSKANSSGGSNTAGTLSFWTKRSEIDTGYLFYARSDDSNVFNVYFSGAERLEIRSTQGGSAQMSYKTNALFRDPSAWYHIVIAIDTTDGTAADRCKLFVNGSRITSFETQTNFGSSNTIEFFQSDATVYVGGEFEGGTIGNPYDGYLAYFHFIDGDAKAASDFGETNDNGVWVPTLYTGSFGTNGFKLEFKQTGTSANASGMGADTSGNGNHLTPSNLTALDVTTDTPQNNFSTLNIVNKYASPLVAEGGLEYDSNSSSGSSLVSTIAPSNGKWYVEVKALTSTIHIGVPEVGLEAFNVKGQGATRPNVNYQYGGGVEIDGSIIDNEATFTSNDIIGIALNLDDGEVIFYKNGTALNSGTAYNLHTNTTHGNTGFGVQTATGSGNTKASFNFGNPAFSISSGNADANGYGNFEYSVPSGYYALCTKNLAEYG